MKTKAESWKFFYANCNGINSKKSSLIETLHELKPQILLFTETKLSTPSFKIEGYTFCGKSRSTNTNGDVGILVSNEIKKHTTPHEPIKDIEIFWISIQREGNVPVYCGVYYGKQESRNSNEQIKKEMDDLCEEILDKKREGEVILFMDANAKIGILNENISRNGRYLLNVVEECDLEIINMSEVCEGSVTRVNRKKPDERSAIDFVMATWFS